MWRQGVYFYVVLGCAHFGRTEKTCFYIHFTRVKKPSNRIWHQGGLRDAFLRCFLLDTLAHLGTLKKRLKRYVFYAF